ncbi:hypothetical protein BSLG_007686 [Batrachochytrium salamandrivorans]|nr:hypothetical protein BASA60_005723 [Batrachochytrium salamandrivorans]KAJ1334531.1 hypothetical protein BSLG_007686 [Batrachochytrium salamandrivorans]
MLRSAKPATASVAAAMRLPSLCSSRQSRTFTRSLAVLSDALNPLTYSRKGPQPAAAPTTVTTVSQAASGVRVATYDHLGPASTLAIVVNAGSRNDTSDAPGTAHMLKGSLIRTVFGDNVTRTIREAELRGNTLHSSVSREHIILASDFLRDDLVDAVPVLISNMFNRSFYPFEFLDAAPRAAEQTTSALVDPATIVFEKLHQIAFRNGLGNPLLASSQALNGLNRAKLFEFVDKYFTADRITVVGSGIAHNELKALVDAAFANVSLSSAKSETPKSKYYGGEARIEAGPNSEAHYVMAFPGVAYTSPEYQASLVLQALLDGSQRVKWGSRSGALAQASTEHTTSVAFSTSYSDAGLFGIHVVGATGEVKQVVSKSLSTLREVSNSISADAFTAAKKAAIIYAEESQTRSNLVDSISKGALSTSLLHTGPEILSINKVTIADVQKLAKTIVASKPSVVALGNSLMLPFAEEF